MKKEGTGPPSENLFLWSTEGIRLVHKRIKALQGGGAGNPRDGSPIDKRLYPRLDLQMPILYRVLGEGASQIPSSVRPFLLAKSTNISPIGLCLSLAEELPRDAVLGLSIHLVDNREKFSAVGRVVWTRPGDQPGQFLTGLQFVVVDKNIVKEEQHSKMESFVRQLQS